VIVGDEVLAGAVWSRYVYRWLVSGLDWVGLVVLLFCEVKVYFGR